MPFLIKSLKIFSNIWKVLSTVFQHVLHVNNSDDNPREIQNFRLAFIRNNIAARLGRKIIETITLSGNVFLERG
jgi:hypothetical protein